jgi:exopolysaccharide biosynthesis protein
MLFRKTLFVLALTGAALPAAFANTGCISTSADGGCSTPQFSSASTKSRADVQKELAAFQKNAAIANASTFVSADGSSSSIPQHSFALRDGKLVHTDKLEHDAPKPSLARTDADMNADQYMLREGYGA